MAAVLILPGIAAAQNVNLDVEVVASGGNLALKLDWQVAGLDTNVPYATAIYRCAGAACMPNTNVAPNVIGASNNRNTLTYTDTGVTAGMIYRYLVDVTGGGLTGSVNSEVSAAILVARGGGAVDNVADDAVLPGVIGNINRGINSSIYRRIQQRQKEDGYWK